RLRAKALDQGREPARFAGRLAGDYAGVRSGCGCFVARLCGWLHDFGVSAQCSSERVTPPVSPMSVPSKGFKSGDFCSPARNRPATFRTLSRWAATNLYEEEILSSSGKLAPEVYERASSLSARRSTLPTIVFGSSV